MKKNINLIIVFIILINIVIMIKLGIQISEKKSSIQIKNKYNLEYNIVEKKDNDIEVEKYISFVRLYNGNVGTNCLKDKVIELANKDIPELYNKIYDLNKEDIEKYYNNEKANIKALFGIDNSDKFKEFVQLLQKQSNTLGNCKKCKLNMDNYKETEEYAYLKLELEYENETKIKFDIQFAMNGNHSGEEYTKFTLSN